MKSGLTVLLISWMHTVFIGAEIQLISDWLCVNRTILPSLVCDMLKFGGPLIQAADYIKERTLVLLIRVLESSKFGAVI